jgi:subtilase family serine protease
MPALEKMSLGSERSNISSDLCGNEWIELNKNNPKIKIKIKIKPRQLDNHIINSKISK